MADRQNIGVGGLYPTGRAPLALDLATPVRAITERRIQQQKEAIAQEKEFMTESQKAILDALSWEAVKGASQKMQELHLENMSKLEDKWADIYAANDGKLSQPLRLQLLRDKQAVEAEKVNMETNVKEFQVVQQAIMNDPNMKVYTKESHDNFEKAVKEGWVGDPTKNWLGILVPKEEDMFSALSDDDMKPFMQSVVSNIDTEGVTVNDDGTITWNENNKRALNRGFEAFANSQRGQDMFMSYGGDEQAKERIRSEFMEIAARDIRKQEYNYQLDKIQSEGNNQSQFSESVKEAIKRNNIPDINPKYADNIVLMNENAEGLRLADEQTLKGLVGNYVQDIDGEAEKVGVQYKKNGINIIIEGSKKTANKPFPYAYKGELDKKNWKLGKDPAASGRLYTNGKQLPDNVGGSIYADWKMERTPAPAMPYDYDKFAKAINDLDVKKEDIYNWIKDEDIGMLPDANIEIKGKDIIFNGVPYQVGKKLGGDAKKGREDLKAAVDAEIKMYQDKLINKPVDEPEVEIPNANESIEVKIGGEEKTMTVEEAVIELMDKGNMTKKEAIEAIKPFL